MLMSLAITRNVTNRLLCLLDSMSVLMGGQLLNRISPISVQDCVHSWKFKILYSKIGTSGFSRTYSIQFVNPPSVSDLEEDVDEKQNGEPKDGALSTLQRWCIL